MQHSEVYLPVFPFITFNCHLVKKKNMVILLVYTFDGLIEHHILQIYVLKNNYQAINSTHCDFSNFTICIHLIYVLFQPIFHIDSCKGIYYIDFSPYAVIQG